MSMKDRGLIKWAPFMSVPWDSYKQVFEDKKNKYANFGWTSIGGKNIVLAESIETNSLAYF